MSLVIATAGHVDHGKSTLVRALTGMDPDRLAAERERGLTIELGFAWGTFSGRPVAFVDVPGHEKFVSTMLAGVGAVPIALFVVAADDPWMPQAQEHLAALDALGVRHGVVAITRADLADPSPMLARAREEIGATSLRGSRVTPVSAVTGEGLADLEAAIADLLEAVPAPDAASDVRMWVDRRFTIAGAGTVVTGTLPAGTIRVGDELASPSGMLRVRGIESRGTELEEVTGPARVALNLTGAGEGLTRGNPLWTPNRWHLTTRVDVRLSGEGTPPPRTPMLHIGAHSTQVNLRQVDPAHAHLTLDTPLPLRQGDRGILRDPGNRRLWGAQILDPAAAPIRGRGAREARASALTRRGTIPDYEAELTFRGVASREALVRLGIRPPSERPWHWSASWEDRTRAAILDLVREYDRAHPTNPGLTASQIIHALDLPLPPGELPRLVPDPLRVEAGKVVSQEVRVPERILDALEVITSESSGEVFAAPTRERLRELGLGDSDLAAAARAKLIFLPAPGVVLPPRALSQAVRILGGLGSPFTAAEARAALGTSRRVAIPILEFLDRAGLTRRLGDDRREFTGA